MNKFPRLCHQTEASPKCSTCDNAATIFDVPHPPFNDFKFVAMIVPTRRCRVPHPLNCLATPLTPNNTQCGNMG